MASDVNGGLRLAWLTFIFWQLNILLPYLDIFFANCTVIFHKNENQTIILRCLRSLNHDWYNCYETKRKKKKSVFVQNCKTPKMEVFTFFVITFKPIRFQTCKVYQNDCLILIFVKDRHTVSEKMARRSRKIGNCYCHSF